MALSLRGQSVGLCGQASQVASWRSHSAGMEKPNAECRMQNAELEGPADLREAGVRLGVAVFSVIMAQGNSLARD